MEQTKMTKILPMVLALSAMGSGSNTTVRAEDFTPNKPKPVIPDGMKEWHIDGQTVYARNRKNAQRKADNLNKTK